MKNRYDYIQNEQHYEMRVLHSTLMSAPEPGILNQLKAEQAAAKRAGIEWTSALFCPKGAGGASAVVVPSQTVASASAAHIGQRALNWWALRKEYYRWLQEQEQYHDVILLRYNVANPLQVAYLRRARIPVYTVHHTIEEREARSAGGIEGRLRCGLDRLLGSMSLRRAAGFIAVTEEIRRYEATRVGRLPSNRTSYVYPNGILYPDEQSVALPDRRHHSIPELIFVASKYDSWHGLDILLNNVQRSRSEFVLHIVGAMCASDKVRAEKDPRIKIHGTISSSEISELSARCWLGLSSFALNRKGMKEACTLKVREYLMNGLPVYAGHSDVFPESFKFYRKGPPVLEDILSYAFEMRKITRGNVALEAKPFISKVVLMEALYKWLKERRG